MALPKLDYVPLNALARPARTERPTLCVIMS
jgi:hypothetical protein